MPRVTKAVKITEKHVLLTLSCTHNASTYVGSSSAQVGAIFDHCPVCNPRRNLSDLHRSEQHPDRAPRRF